MDLRVEYYQDEDAGQWGFVVPRLHIVGGGLPTRAEAVEQARDAILFTLEGDEDESPPPGRDVGYFHVTIDRAS